VSDNPGLFSPGWGKGGPAAKHENMEKEVPDTVEFLVPGGHRAKKDIIELRAVFTKITGKKRGRRPMWRTALGRGGKSVVVTMIPFANHWEG